MAKPSKEFVKNRLALIKAMDYAVDKIKISGYYLKEVTIIKGIITEIKQNKTKHFVCVVPQADLAVTYAKDDQSSFEDSKRVSTTLARYIRRQLNITDKTISDTVLDIFCNHVNSYVKYTIEVNDGFKILYGKDILSWYKKVTGKFASCMSGENYFRVEIYGLNPDKVSLLTYKEEGRALLWTCDDGTKYMDRIYSVTKFNSLFEMWANDHKYETFNAMPSKQMKVTLKYGRYLPSIDTFFNVKYDTDTKTVVACSREFAGSKRTSLDNLCAPGMEPLKCIHKDCGKVLPDEDEFKTKRGRPICPKCKEFLDTCRYCKDNEVVVGDYDLCGTCEKELIRRCANHMCGRRADKTAMIKMRRPNAVKICFACSDQCRDCVNPSWIMQVEK